MNLEQGGNESLRDYIKRFTTTIKSVEKLINDVAILALQSGFRASNDSTSLTKKPATTLSKAMKRAYQEMDVEEMLEWKFKKARARTNNPINFLVKEKNFSNGKNIEERELANESNENVIPTSNQREFFLNLRD